jgi:undecaprenyl-diphosphatase
MSSVPPPERTPPRFRAVARLLAALTIVGLSVLAWASAASAHHGSPVMVGSALPPDVAAAAGDQMGPGRAVVLGLVEGITEYLPVSSTGHLTVAERILGMTDDATKDARDAYAVVIQAGAILAVLVLYRQRLLDAARGAITLPGHLRSGSDTWTDGERVVAALIVGVLPALVTGFVLEKKIKEHLFGTWPVVAAWVVGGIVLLALSKTGWWERRPTGTALVDITVRDALIIGVAQCLALWPGTSRSLVTIVAALLVGLRLSAAVEFSFLLGFLTLGAATAYDALKHGPDIVAAYGVFSPVLGFVVAFAAAVVAVRWMVTYLEHHDLAIFGWYRLGIAAVTVGLLAAGTI